MDGETVDAKPKPKKRISWRNVMIVCLLQLPIYYYAVGLIPMPYGLPRPTSPLGRYYMSVCLQNLFPELFNFKGKVVVR